MAVALADAAAKFDSDRAGEYEKQARIALAGYDACHELSACMLAAALGAGTTASILIVGVGGTAQEIITAAKLEPNWRFVAVDPSQPMLDLAVQRLTASGLAGRAEMRLGYVDDVPADAMFDAATLIGVLHHLPGDEAKNNILKGIAKRLKPKAPLILAANHYGYSSQPLLLAAWGERWRMQGATAEEVKIKLGKILQGADPPQSEAAVTALLEGAGFGPAVRFFGSLFWGAWLARREDILT